jgi:hypothetical protein
LTAASSAAFLVAASSAAFFKSIYIDHFLVKGIDVYMWGQRDRAPSRGDDRKMYLIFLILSRKNSEIHLIQALHLKYLFYEKLKKKLKIFYTICDEIFFLYENYE